MNTMTFSAGHFLCISWFQYHRSFGFWRCKSSPGHMVANRYFRIMPSSSHFLEFEHGICYYHRSFTIVSRLFTNLFVLILFSSKRGRQAEISFWGQEKSQYLINKKIVSLSALDTFLSGKLLVSRESREARPTRVGGPANIAASAMWTEVIITTGPGSEKFQPKITMRMDMQNCWLVSIMIETNSAVKPSILILQHLLDDLAREKVLMGSSVTQLKSRYMPSLFAKNDSKGAARQTRIYRDNRAIETKSGSAKSRGSQISAEEALEKFREQMEQVKQMQLEAKSAGSQTSNI